MAENQNQPIEIGDDLEIIKTTRRAAASGTWVIGRLNDHRFEALVFPAHADNPDWEIGRSQISKLWIERLADERTVFNWDRGMDMPPADDLAARIVDFLADGLAEHIYGEKADARGGGPA